MNQKIIYLKDIDPKMKDSNAYIVSYQIEMYTDGMDEYYPRPGLLIVPGGAYHEVSDREGEPVALRFMVEGFNTFVLKYTIERKYPIPHEELAVALDYINRHSDELGIYKNKTSIIGFSAGGHLVSSYGFTYKEQAKSLGLEESSIRPFAIIAGYPVTLMGNGTHLESAKVITENDPELLKKLDVPSNIKTDYPPTFIFSTKYDDVVPIINTIEFVNVLNKNDIKNDYVIYENGGHGGSLYTRGVFHETIFDIKNILENKDWVNKAVEFIYDLFK